MIKLERVYEIEKKPPGYSILIDRLWPRGIKKEVLKADKWIKDIAPSTPLRKWFGHDPEKWPDFKRKYKEELKEKKAILQEIKALEKAHREITLLYAAKDEKHNNALLLKEVLDAF